MSARVLVAATVTILAASAPAWPAATPEGAKAIARGYADWFTPAVTDRGIVSVAAQGDNYLVTWDFQKLIDMAGLRTDVIKIDNFNFLMTPTGDQAWVFKAERFPAIMFDVAAGGPRTAGTIDLSGFHAGTAYDGKARQFLTSTIVAGLLSAKYHIDDPNSPSGDVDLAERGLSFEMKSAAGVAGTDHSFSGGVKSLTQTFDAPAGRKNAGPVKMALTMGSELTEGSVSGLRSHEMGDLWKLVAAFAPQDRAPPDLREHIAAMLPLWNEVRATAEVNDLTLDFNMSNLPIHAGMKAVSEIIAMTGLASHAAIELGMKISDVRVDAGVLPAWASSLQPLSVDFDVKVAVDGMDEAARVAVADQQFLDKGELSDAAKDKAREILMQGHPRLIVAPGRFAAPTLDLTYEGELAIGDGRPNGHFTVTADGLDKAQALIQQVLKDAPDAQRALLVFALVKGLAMTGPNGRLIWKIDIGADAAVLINGAPMPTGLP